MDRAAEAALIGLSVTIGMLLLFVVGLVVQAHAEHCARPTDYRARHRESVLNSIVAIAPDHAPHPPIRSASDGDRKEQDSEQDSDCGVLSWRDALARFAARDWDSPLAIRVAERGHFYRVTRHHPLMDTTSDKLEPVTREANGEAKGQAKGEEVARGDGSVVVLYSGGSWAGVCECWGALHRCLNFCRCTETLALALRFVRYARPMCTVVGFDYPASRLSSLNMGQEDDCFSLSVAFDAVKSAYPRSRIVLAGDCLGALRIIKWLQTTTSDRKDGVSGVILESPLPSFRYFSNIICRCKCTCAADALSAALPNYNQSQDKVDAIVGDAKVGDAKVGSLFAGPALVGLIEGDPISPAALSGLWAQLFPSVHLFRCDEDLFHGDLLPKHEPFQDAVRTFLRTIK